MARPFTPDWLRATPAATSLLPRPHADPAARASAVAVAAEQRCDPAVLEALAPVSDAQRAHRDALAERGTVSVVTGQQAGLFGGPLYTLYKAASALVNARALEAETGRRCVPVFWLQSEDHDYDEIATCVVPRDDGTVHRLRASAHPAEPPCSIATRVYDDSLADVLDRLQELLEEEGSHAADTVDLLRRCYAPGRAPSEAFRALVEAWFADAGLLVVDPCHPALRAAARPLHLRAVDEAEDIEHVLVARAGELEAAGFEVQVHVRPGSPLSFVHPEGADGPRYRVEPGPSPAERRLCGTDRTIPAAAVREGPFSTSALLRPLLQDTLLPTVAYVGGPGEIAYFAQLPPLYAYWGRPMPMIVPRARFRVLDAVSARLLGQLGISADALSRPRAELLAEVAPSGGPGLDPDALEQALTEGFQSVLAAFAPQADALDPGLGKSVGKTRKTMARAARKLTDRYRRALTRHDDVAMARLDRVRARLYPDGPQERVHAWPWYGARYGVRGFVDAVLRAVRPFDGAVTDLDPDHPAPDDPRDS